MEIAKHSKKNQLELLKDVEDIQSAVNEASKILGNPISLYDTSYNLLAHTENIVTDDPLWNEFVTLETFSHETVDFFNTEDFILAYAQSEIVSWMKSDKLKYDRMTGKLFDKDNVQLGNITVIFCMKPFEDGDAELIEFLCEILSVKLQNSEFYQKIERVYEDSLFTEVLISNIKKHSETIAELYDELKYNLYLAVVEVTQYEHTVTHLAYFRDLFRKIQPEHKYFVYLNNIIIILSTDNKILSIKKDMKVLNEFFKQYHIYAGISSKFQDLKEADKYYREAINALNYGIKGMKNQNIFSYDYYRIEHFLHSVNRSSETENIYNPTISIIQEYDRENGTAFADSLYIYLLYGGHIEEASMAANISHDELRETLKTIEDMFEIDLKSGDVLANLFISFKMLKDD